ncbi:hypothetical protein D3C76_1422650 [compost metagenome]
MAAFAKYRLGAYSYNVMPAFSRISAGQLLPHRSRGTGGSCPDRRGQRNEDFLSDHPADFEADSSFRRPVLCLELLE